MARAIRARRLRPASSAGHPTLGTAAPGGPEISRRAQSLPRRRPGTRALLSSEIAASTPSMCLQVPSALTRWSMQPQELIRSSRLRISTSYWPPLAERARNAPKKPQLRLQRDDLDPLGAAAPAPQRDLVLVAGQPAGRRFSIQHRLGFGSAFRSAWGGRGLRGGSLGHSAAGPSVRANRSAETILRPRGAPQWVSPLRTQEFGATGSGETEVPPLRGARRNDRDDEADGLRLVPPKSVRKRHFCARRKRRR